MANDDRVAKLEAKVAELNDRIKKKAGEKDAAANKYRAELLKLNADRDEVHAELVAARKVAGLSDTERTAVAAELAKAGN